MNPDLGSLFVPESSQRALAASDTRTLKYDPRSQFRLFHRRNHRWACIVAHRRAGKTVACVNELIIRALYSQKHNPRYAYIAPFYSQAKDAAWTYLKEFARPFVTDPTLIRESDLSVTLANGARIRLYGADNPDSLRGIYLDGVILDEYGDCRPSLWAEVILPTLSDRRGWAVFIGTPKGKNHFYDIYQRSIARQDWYELTLKASDTGIVPHSELEELRAQQSEEQHRQEYECDFTAAVLGTYYAKQISLLEQQGHIAPTEPQYDPQLPVHVALDLGYKDSTALWFWQHAPQGLHIIDYEEHQAEKLAFYMDLLDAKPYHNNYERIWLPHDARAHTLQTGRTTAEQFKDPPQYNADDHPLDYIRSPYPIAIVPNVKKQQGIDAARLVLPHCRFNRSKCYGGIEALRAYRRKYDELLKQFSTTPLHDWSSDGADAFRYLALVARSYLPTPEDRTFNIDAPPTLQSPSITLDQLYEDRDANRPRFHFQRRMH